MKKFLVILLLVSLVLFGCTHTLTSVERKYGPPSKIVKCGDETSYYYFFRVRGQVPSQAFGPYPSPALQAYASGWRLQVFTAGKDKKIIEERIFWRQP